MKKIAIIMATYNGSAFLRQQIESIRAQTQKNITLYVRDDGSTDDTVEILQSYLKSESWIELVKDGLGPSKLPGLNFFRCLRSVEISKYDFIAFCDQDDVWMPDKLESAIRRMGEGSYDGYSSNLLAFDDASNRAWYIRKNFPEKKLDYMFQGGSAGCTYVLTSKAAKMVMEQFWRGDFVIPSQFSHDWIIYAICRSFGLQWCHDDVAKILYRQHAVNSFGALPGLGGMFARLKLARSGWYQNNVILVGSLLAGTPAEFSVLERVRRFSFRDRISLALDASKFRRHPKDAVLLAAILLFGFF
jgi:rhamnosyltransferase